MKPHNDKISLNLRFFFFLSMILFNYFIIDFPITSQPLLTYKSPNACIVLGEVVNVRVSPNTSAPIVTAVRENQIIQLIGWKANVETIGKFKDKWAKIRTQEGKTGYIFGAFIFEVKNLYKPFKHKYNVGVINKITFHVNGTYVETGAQAYQNYVKKGIFRIEGRKITLQEQSVIINNAPDAVDSQPIVYYLSRYEQKNYLMQDKKSLDEVIIYFQKLMGAIEEYYSN